MTAAGSRTVLNALVGFVVGVAGGLVGLGGAELRLPYFIGALGLSPHQAVRVNLAISLFTIAAAVPVRFIASPLPTSAHLPEALAIAIGAVIAAYLGATWLHRISSVVLARLITVLLAILGVGLLIEAGVEFQADGLLPDSMAIRVAAGLLFGFAIGAISSLLGVAGGEVIIPTLVFGYGRRSRSPGRSVYSSVCPPL